MRWIGILNDDGKITEEGTCPDNCDIVTALGRETEKGERYIDGKGITEEEAIADARFSYPTIIEK